MPRDGNGRSWPVYHLSVCARDGRELRRHLTLRDWLRAHPERAAAYGALKLELAARHRHDRDASCEAKTAFVEGTLREARGNHPPRWFVNEA